MTVKAPRQSPMVIVKEKEVYQFWLTLSRNFPRIERLGLGQKIENVFLEILELTFSCIYLPPKPKILLLGKTISKLDVLKFFCQLAWESRLIPTEKYTELSAKLEEIGRMLGGWRKGLQSPPATRAFSKTLTTK
ncbi:MAG: four helix bundle protein [Candidatus Taylorbacteria bacterium]|nr:four helix bundle protein [Candidatus Taylorbacteria bacterium]